MTLKLRLKGRSGGFPSAGAVMLQVGDCGECGKTASEGMEEHAREAWYDKN